MRLLLFVLLAAANAVAADNYLFTSFRGNGESGIYFALSADGYQWTPLNANQAFLRPQFAWMLMRDPCLAKGPDGVWHMVWTTAWRRREPSPQLTIGHATSRDLVKWSEQQLIEIKLEGALNAWAPELVWDAGEREWIIFWSSTIPGKFPQETSGSGEGGLNHRVWSITTRDFAAFSEPRVYLDPGFNCIDATLARDGKRWVMVFKDERREPVKKNLRLAFADSPAGPWTGITETFSISWVEGPSVVRARKDWLIYFDHYGEKNQYYGAYRTRDWKSFEDVTKQMSFPSGHKHGTVVRLSAAEARRLPR